MTGPSGNWHYARQRHLRICKEDVWAQCPTSPSWRSVPVFGDGFKLKATNPRFRPDTLYEGYRGSVQISHVRLARGRFETLPWPEVTAVLLEMALERDGSGLGSYCMDCFTPADPRRYLGVMVDELEVMASAQNRDVRFRFGLRAKDEASNAGLGEEDFDYSDMSPVPFTFDRATVSLGGGQVSDAEEFVLQVRNELAEGPNCGGAIAYLLAGRRTITLELGKLDNGSAVNEAVRGEGTLSFHLTLTHPAGHSLVVTLPELHPEANEERAPPGELARGVMRARAATDAGGDDITYSLDLVP